MGSNWSHRIFLAVGKLLENFFFCQKIFIQKCNVSNWKLSLKKFRAKIRIWSIYNLVCQIVEICSRCLKISISCPPTFSTDVVAAGHHYKWCTCLSVCLSEVWCGAGAEWSSAAETSELRSWLWADRPDMFLLHVCSVHSGLSSYYCHSRASRMLHAHRSQCGLPGVWCTSSTCFWSRAGLTVSRTLVQRGGVVVSFCMGERLLLLTCLSC